MADAYVEMRAGLLSHPKMNRLKRALKTPPIHLAGHLYALWTWVMQYAPNGDLTRFGAIDIAEAAQWEDDAEVFVEALINCRVEETGGGFLRRTASGKLLVHDWHHFGGRILITRWKDNYRNTYKTAATLEQVRAAGLFPDEMWRGSDEPILSPPPASATPASSGIPPVDSPTPSEGSKGFRGNPPDSEHRAEKQRTDKRSVEQQKQSKEESVRGDPEPNPLPALPAAPPGQSAAAFSPTALDPEEDSPQVPDPGDVPPADLGGLLAAAPLVAELQAHGVNRADAERLAREKPDECCRQLAWIKARAPYKSGEGACLASAIDGAWEMPKAFRDAEKRKADEQQKAMQSAASKIAQAEKDAARQAEAAALAAERERLEREEPDRLAQLRETVIASMPSEIQAKPESNLFQSTLRTRLDRSILALAAQKGMPAAVAGA